MAARPLTTPRTLLFRVVAFGLVPILILYLSFRTLFSRSTSTSRSMSWSSSLPGMKSIYSPAPSLLDDALNRTLGFEKVFVINLASRTDHRDATSLAAHFTDLDLEYVDGVTNVEQKTLPPFPEGFEMQPGGWNAWRAHMNVARTIVERNLTSALILEDDVDWDIRIKTQMRQFAQASQLLLQPLAGTQDQYLDPTRMRHSKEDQQPEDITFASGPIQESETSPYGDVDKWDILWLGHCGTRFPNAKTMPNVPLGRVVIPNDPTVPEPHHLNMETGDHELLTMFPNHTRIVHAEAGSTCSFAYALSLTGAQNLLYQFSMRRITAAFDQMLPDLCMGRNDRKKRPCLSVQPALIQHHRVGKSSSWSDIDDYSRMMDDGRKIVDNKAFTTNIRWSTKLNIPNFIDRQTDYFDQFPDGAERPDIGW